ncbi:MAG: carbohydrate porin [Alphaproteobacteria bacterium]
MEIKKYGFVLATTLIMMVSPAMAEEKDYQNTTLSGNWGGVRDSLAQKGINTDITYKLDGVSNIAGGAKEGARILDNLDIVFSMDGEKLVGSSGTSALLYLLNNNGGRPDGDLVKSGQGIDNIEVPRATAKLYQAWIQQELWDKKLSLLAGLYDLNSEFYVTPASGMFIHPTYGIGTDMSQSGTNGPSIFPFSALAARVKIQPLDNMYVQAAVIDGVAGDPSNPTGTQIEWHKKDTTLLVGEAGYNADNHLLAVGGWRYSKRFADYVAVDSNGNALNTSSSGLYLLGETPVNDNITAFARLGFADGDVNQFNYAWSTGIVYKQIFPSREQGQLGVAIHGAHNSSPYKKSQLAAATPVDNSEHGIEVTYSDQLTPWLKIQPDVQYIINPGTTPNVDDALIIGTRLTINF